MSDSQDYESAILLLYVIIFIVGIVAHGIWYLFQ